MTNGYAQLVAMHSWLIDHYRRAKSTMLGEEGQGLVEYALIITFVALVALVGLMFLGEHISTLLKEVGEKL